MLHGRDTCPLVIPVSGREREGESPHNDCTTCGDHDPQHDPISDQQTQVIAVEVLDLKRDLGLNAISSLSG